MAAADVQQMVQILQALNGNDNAARQQAEQLYDSVKQTQPAQLCALLVQILLQQGGDEGVRHSASVFFWKLVRRQTNGQSSFAEVPAQQAGEIKQALLQVLNVEQNGMARRKLAEACAEIGCNEGSQWPELFQAIFGWSAGASQQKETALRILKGLADEEDCAEQLMQDKAKMAQLLQAGINDPDAAVKCQAVLLVLAFVESDVEKKSLQAMLPLIVGVVKQFAVEKKEQELNEVLKELIELIEEDSAWFKPQAEELLQTLVQMAQATSMDEQVRRLAFEFIVSYAEKKPKQCAKLPGFAKGLFQLAMGFMLELEDDDDWEAQDDEGDEDQAMFECGSDGVDRLAKAFGAEQLPQTALALVQEFMQQTWAHKFAALMSVRQLAETVEDEAVVDGLVTLCVQSLQAPEARVRHAALSALAQAATDQEPYLQEKHGAALVPLLLGRMADPCDRVKTAACSAFVNLGEELEQGAMLQNLQGLMGALSQLLGSPSRAVKQEAITAVAVIAGVVEEHFVPYYAHVVPGLKQIVAQCGAKEEQKLRGKAFECLSVVGLSVGKQTFAPDCVEIMQAMMAHLSACRTNPELADDPQKNFIEEACERVCRCMKADFLPFVKPLLDLCFQGLQVQAEVLSRDQVEDETEDHSLKFLADGTCTGLKTSQIEDIKACISMVQCFVEVLEENFADYIEATHVQVFGLLDFAHDAEIRDHALKTWSGLMKAYKKVCVLRNIADQSMHATMLRSAIIKVLSVIKEDEEDEDPDLEEMATLAEGLAECIKEGPPNVLLAMEVSQLVEKTLEMVKESMQRRDAAERKKKKGKMDEDEEEELAKKKEQEEVLRDNLIGITGKLMQTQRAAFVEAGAPQRLAQLLQGLCGSKKDGDGRLAVFLACDFLEHLPEAPLTAELWPGLLQQLFAGVQDAKDAELRQGAAFGLNVAASSPLFAQCAAQAAAELAKAIEHPSAKKKASKAATDNLVAALGRVCEKQAQQVQPAHWDLWLQKLPLVNDDEEGHKTHQSLLQLIQAQHPVFQDPAKLSRGLEVLAMVYKADAASEETHKGTMALFLAVGAQLEALAAGWSEKAKARLQRVVRDAQAGK